MANFNPRSHEGSDAIKCNNKRKCDISIHAPTRGATSMEEVYYNRCKISIHAPTRGATKIDPKAMVLSVISIHAPTRGATQSCLTKTKPTFYFNPRSHEGSDSNFRQKVLFSLSKNCLKYLILTTNYFN